MVFVVCGADDQSVRHRIANTIQKERLDKTDTEFRNSVSDYPINKVAVTALDREAAQVERTKSERKAFWKPYGVIVLGSLALGVGSFVLGTALIVTIAVATMPLSLIIAGAYGAFLLYMLGVVSALVSGMMFDAASRQSNASTLVRDAVNKNDLKTVEMYLKAFSTTEITDKQQIDYTDLLGLARANGSIEMMRLLTAYGGRPDILLMKD